MGCSDSDVCKGQTLNCLIQLAALAVQMWTDRDPGGLAEEFRELIQNEDAACFIRYDSGRPVAFAQCQLRHDYVEGTDSSPVG